LFFHNLNIYFSSATTVTGSFLSPIVGSLRKSSSAVEWSSAADNEPIVGQKMSTLSGSSANIMSTKSANTTADLASNQKSLTAAVAAAVQSAQHDHHHNNSSGIFNMFSRGFLAKPVVRSEEETYRYLMALDR
jgi:hypothetical protein